MAGVRLEANFHIITGDIASAKIFSSVKSGLELDQLVLEPLASSSVLTEEEKEADALVDIGGVLLISLSSKTE